ncbi:MAG: SIR2 family protein [Candidatus Binatia bacterium]
MAGYLGRPRLLLGKKNYLAPHWEKRWRDLSSGVRIPSDVPEDEAIQRRREAERSKAEGLKTAKAEILNEVRALHARWLRMQNLCILTGAGSSKCMGGPLGAELFTRCKELFEVSRFAGRAKGFHADLLQALRDTGAQPNYTFDFEEFLSLLSTARRCFDGGRGSFKDGFALKPANFPKRRFNRARLAELIDAIEKALAVVCNVSLASEDELLEPNCPAARRAHLAFVSKILSRDPTLGRVRLATTNYDTLFEQALDRLGVFYADGFAGTVRRHFRPGTFAIDVYYPGEVAEGRVRRHDRFLHLYKLHGSITWRRAEASAMDPFGISCDTAGLPTLDDVREGSVHLRDVLTDLHTGQHVGLGILPTSAKYGETLTMPFSHLFRALGNVLLEPQTACLVIGYSGWDNHLNRLIEDALATPSFTLVIVDPGTKPKEWASLMLRSDHSDRVYWFGGDWARFERFAYELVPDVEQLKTDQDVAKQLREIQRSRGSQDISAGGDENP